jgi:glutathione S-transferase
MIELYHSPRSRSLRIVWLLEELGLHYALERYGDGRLAPPIGSAQRGPFLQWLHFAEATLFTGCRQHRLRGPAWHTQLRQDADEIPQAIEDYRAWLTGALDLVDRTLDGADYLLGETFSAADIAVGHSLFVAQASGLLGAEYPNTTRYVARSMERPALREAAAL